MPHLHERTLLLIGDDALARLRQRHVFIAGLGGVGSYAAEAIARAGVGRITLLDHDVVAPSNLNRQLVALHSTLERPKAEVMAERIRDIDPSIELHVRSDFLMPSTAESIVHENQPVDWMLDCIDSIACKAAMVHACQRLGVPVASSMGAGGRMDVTKVRVGPLKKTELCPLAREMRKRLRDLGGSLDYPVVYSTEKPRKGTEHRPIGGNGPTGRPRSVNGTISYLPALFGMTLAGYVIRQMLQ
ncbi:MAG: tRNA threonylcarbamoyladenosine dehydratase [Chromatiales bacterium]|jgi:tRNA A37 threonylcarbamoyladenosine dehydratase|nr:tRNA threonylcarbamoyladenosine dehydratase [Chromatiales bacterium]MDX9765982.1 tRNA threonylcarbamoyladenosine dehydratase [Ectothiorhodospiraceae bacterium]